MSLTHSTLSSLFTAIADAIRAKSWSSASIVADDFPTAIRNIPQGGNVTGAFVGETYNSNGDVTSAVVYGVTSIRDHMFSNCSSMSTVLLPSDITSIGEYAFSGCTSLTLTSLPNNITGSIGRYAFSNCNNMQIVNLELKCSSLGTLSLSMSSLRKVWIRSTCTTITGTPFGTSNSSLTIYVEASSKPSGWSSNFYGNSTVVYNQTTSPW